MQDRGREKAEICNSARNIERTRERQGFAGVDRFGTRQLLEIALDQIGDAQKNPRPLLRRRARPIRERLLRRGHGKIDIARVAVRNLRVRLSCRRLDIVEIFPANGVNELAVDEVFDLSWLFLHSGYCKRQARAAQRRLQNPEIVRGVSTSLDMTKSRRAQQIGRR